MILLKISVLGLLLGLRTGPLVISAAPNQQFTINYNARVRRAKRVTREAQTVTVR